MTRNLILYKKNFKATFINIWYHCDKVITVNAFIEVYILSKVYMLFMLRCT